MFENLTEKLQRTFKNLRGQGKLTEEHLDAALAEIREALLAKGVGTQVWPGAGTDKPLEIVRGAIKEAKLSASDVVLVDTAGRLHIDDELMNELSTLKKELQPAEMLFIADAMIGQDAVRSAVGVHKRPGVPRPDFTEPGGGGPGRSALAIAEV